MSFKTIIMSLLLVAPFAHGSRMSDALREGYKCRDVNPVLTYTLGNCVQQFACERSGVPTLYFSGAVPLDEQNECPRTAEDFELRSKNSFSKIRIGPVKIEDRKDDANESCKPTVEEFGLKGEVSMAQYYDGKDLHSFCIVGAACGSRQGAVTCSPRARKIRIEKGKEVKEPYVCPDFDFCLTNKLSAPKDLLANYSKDRGEKASLSPHSPTLSNETGNGSTAITHKTGFAPNK